MFVKHCCRQCMALSSSWHEFLILVLYLCFFGFLGNIPADRWAELLSYETNRDLCGKQVGSERESQSAFTTLKRNISKENGKEPKKDI